MSKPINVVMIGPKSCGKTSILSVMLTNIQEFITRMTAVNPAFSDQAIRPSLEPVGMAHESLKSAYAKLESLAEAARKSPDAVDMEAGAIMGDLSSRVTPVAFRMGESETQFNFFDFPGGFYSQAQIDRNAEKGFSSWSKADVEQWEEIVRTADVIMLAIDATVQVGQQPLLKDKTYYERITNLVKDSIKRSMTTLIFVPVKCEHLVLKYDYNDMSEKVDFDFSNEGCTKLEREVERLFPDLLSFVRDPDVFVNVDAYFTPMITVGGIKCVGSRFNSAISRGVASFAPALTKHYALTPFLPKNCDKIFAMCLLRAYEPMDEEWKSKRTIWQRLTGAKSPIRAFFEELANAINFNRMYGIYVANNRDFLTTYYRERIQDEAVSKAHIEMVPTWSGWSELGTEDGCKALNLVWIPGNVPV